jgi:hypothetical protein
MYGMFTTLVNTLSKLLVTPLYYFTTFMNWVQYNVGYYKNYVLHEYAHTGLANLGLMGTVALTVVLMPPVLWFAKRNKSLAFMIGFIYDPQSAMVAAALAWLFDRI